MSCTLAQLAEQLQIPEEFLRELGLADSRLYGGSVRIPYANSQGQEIATRFMVALDGPDRFRWPQGAQIALYGLSRMGEPTARSTIALVNGEADCLTLWWENFPAIGLPGVNAWDERRDAQPLIRYDKIYIAVQGGPTTATLLDWLSRSAIRESVYLINLPEDIPNLSALYQLSPMDFGVRWQGLIEQATEYNAREQQERINRRNQARARAERLLRSDDILEQAYRICQAHLAIVDERRLVKLIYLTTTSRLLDRIVSLIVKGTSATGKSFLVQQVLKLFPPSSYLAFTGMSERALVRINESLQHRMLVLYEATGLSSGFLAYSVRTLLTENKLRYSAGGQTLEIEGPTGLITTTTALTLHQENETRCLIVTTDDSAQQTFEIMAQQANSRARATAPRLWDWHALQRYLELSPRDVEIPFATILARLIPPVAVRLRRDFPTLLALIEAHALLHQYNRERDEDGTILANMSDYGIVRELVGDLITQEAGIGIPAIVRETRQVIDGLLQAGRADVTVQQVARVLELDTSATWRRVQLAIELGVVRNLQTRARQPARLVAGDDLPGTTNLLPSVAAVEAALRERGNQRG